MSFSAVCMFAVMLIWGGGVGGGITCKNVLNNKGLNQPCQGVLYI